MKLLKELLRTKIKSKKAQIEVPIITFIIVVAGLIIIAPIILKIVKSTLTPFGSAIGNMSSEAGTSVEFVKTTFINFWDWVILIAFTINVILLLISAFLVDVHPIWLILYILFGIFTFSFAPMIKDVLDKIYDSAIFATEVSSLPIVDFLRGNFGIIILAIFIVSGVIMYSKFRLGQNQ